MSVSHVHDYLIVYHSVGGNTKQLASLLECELNILGRTGKIVLLEDTNYKLEIEDTYKTVYIGTPTYGKGKTPDIILKFLRYLLKENDFNLPVFNVFGTGDSQWGNSYCRAVDEVYYHLSKKCVVNKKLKIEQYPINKRQIKQIQEFVHNTTLGG